MTRSPAAQPVPMVHRVRIKGYRSFADADVILGPLTVVVGFNASGKSNFLDTLRFVAEALETSPAQAVAARGGLETLLHRSPHGTADSFEIRLDLRLALSGSTDAAPASYGFEIGPDPTGDLPLLVLREEAAIDLPDGRFELSTDSPARTSRLRLPTLFPGEGTPPTILESALRTMRFYELDSAVLRELDEQPPRRPTLGPSGQHLGRLLGELANDRFGKERLDSYLSALVPDVLGVDERREGRYSTVQARFRTDAGETTFLRESLSEGTLLAAGTLVALAQPALLTGKVPLIGIEEPETALHPAGVNALYEALHDASGLAQVVVTSQSSDLLDSEYTRLEHIRVVANIDGATRIGPVDAAGHSIVEKGLMSISELHRSGQMRPEPATPDVGETGR